MENYSTARAIRRAIRRVSGSLLIILTGFFCGAFGIAQVTVPNTFKPGNPIKSADVNANFKALEAEINRQSSLRPPSNNTAVVVNVVCDGTGTKVANALANINPLIAVYEVRLTGQCPEDVSVSDFFRLKVTSANPSSPATINSFDNANSIDVTLENVKILHKGGSDCSSFGCPALSNLSPGRLSVFDVDIQCVNAGQCADAIITRTGEIRLYSVTKSGVWNSSGARVVAIRNGSILVSSSQQKNSACFAADEYYAQWGGIIVYSPNRNSPTNCPAFRKTELDGGAVYRNQLNTY